MLIDWHGLIRPSFIPPPEIRELRGLTRQRRKMVQAGASERNRVQKWLEEANIKPGNVLTDVFGVTGQKMLEALLEGNTDAGAMAELAKGKARRKWPELQAALAGHRLNATLRFPVARNLRPMEFLEGEIAALDEQIDGIVEKLARSGAVHGGHDSGRDWN